VHVSEFESADFSSTETGKAEREGLPPGYRMRADAHYVDALSGTPRADRGRDSGRSAVADPITRPGVTNPRLLDQLAEDVSAIESAAALLTADKSALMRRVGLDLIKAQATRASWLLRANALLAGAEPDDQARRRPLGDILAHVRERAAVECRLMGVGLELHVTPEAARVPQPETTVAAGVMGLVLAQLGLCTGTEGATIRIQAALLPGEMGSLSIDVLQDAAPVPAGGPGRFFDADWVARPGGWLAAIGAATARAAADRLDGSAAVVTTERRGCKVNLTLT
jgi:hypothetical protein